MLKTIKNYEESTLQMIILDTELYKFKKIWESIDFGII